MNEANYLSFLHTTEGTTRAEKVKMFPKVQLELINGTIYDTEGTIETVTGQVDPTTGTVSFRARFANPTGILAMEVVVRSAYLQYTKIRWSFQSLQLSNVKEKYMYSQ